MSASREAEQLREYARLLRKWNATINLVAPNTIEHLEQRHFQDCNQLNGLAPRSSRWADLGAGGGLPGLVLAIHRPADPMILVEADRRKAAFLRTVAREIDLPNVTVQVGRIEALPALQAQIISARALAPLPLLMAYVDRHLASGGVAWLMKGRNWEAEVSDARDGWNFSLIAHDSTTEPGAAILEISDITRHG